MKGGERFSFSDLNTEFNSSPDGYALFNQAKKYKKISSVLKLVSLTAAIATVSFAASQDKNKMLIGFGVQFASLLGSSKYSSLFLEQTDRALWQRNKDILFNPR